MPSRRDYRGAFKRLASEEGANLIERIINLRSVKIYLANQRQKAIIKEKTLLNQQTLTGFQQKIISTITSQGYWQGSIDSLLPAEAVDQLLCRGQQLSQQLEQQDHSHSNTVALNPSEILNDINNWVIYQAGLNEQLLKIAHHYIRLPVAYHGAEIRLSRAVPGRLDWTGPRVPHYDAEEGQIYPMLKAVLYLSDVTENTGPFTLIKDGHPITLPGKPGTLILADTSLTLHHGMPLRHGKRSVLFWTYTSRRPHYPHRCIIWPHSHWAVRQMTSSLSANQQQVARWREAFLMVLCPVKYHPLPGLNLMIRDRNNLV
jgi:hypothetical protein